MGKGNTAVSNTVTSGDGGCVVVKSAVGNPGVTGSMVMAGAVVAEVEGADVSSDGNSASCVEGDNISGVEGANVSSGDVSSIEGETIAEFCVG